MSTYLRKISLLSILFLFLFCNATLAQKSDSIRKDVPLKASANVNITNNGVSLFPNLSLGKPAAIINVSVGKKGIFFEPELRWGLNGKPWSYIFWMRYKLRPSQKFGVNMGAHPSYIIREATVGINGQNAQRWLAQRYVAAEVVPTYYFSKKFALGFHILRSKSLDSYGIQYSQFLSVQPKFPTINLSKDYYFGFFPQVFNLILDDKKGTYYSQLLSLNKRNLPVYLSSVATYKLKSTVPGDNLVWNVGLNFRL